MILIQTQIRTLGKYKGLGGIEDIKVSVIHQTKPYDLGNCVKTKI